MGTIIQRGPIYGVPLLDSLPLGDTTMLQALPSEDDLQQILDLDMGCSHRVVAGFEVLTAAYQKLLDTHERS